MTLKLIESVEISHAPESLLHSVIYVKKFFGEQFNLEDLLFVSLSKISLDCGTKQYVGKPKIFVIFRTVT